MKSDGSTAEYYELPEGATEIQHLISHRNMNAQVGEIFRTCYRFGVASHSDQLRDAKKIQFYAAAEVERLEKLREGAHVRTGEPETDPRWEQGEVRIDDIGRGKGNDGLHYPFESAPEGATHYAVRKGVTRWYAYEAGPSWLAWTGSGWHVVLEIVGASPIPGRG